MNIKSITSNVLGRNNDNLIKKTKRLMQQALIESADNKETADLLAKKFTNEALFDAYYTSLLENSAKNILSKLNIQQAKKLYK